MPNVFVGNEVKRIGVSTDWTRWDGDGGSSWWLCKLFVHRVGFLRLSSADGSSHVSRNGEPSACDTGCSGPARGISHLRTDIRFCSWAICRSILVFCVTQSLMSVSIVSPFARIFFTRSNSLYYRADGRIPNYSQTALACAIAFPGAR